MNRDDQLGGVSVGAARAWCRDHGTGVIARGEEAIDKIIGYRADQRREDPWVHGYEPPIWLVVCALLRNAVVTESMRRMVKGRCGLTWEVFAERMRAALGFTTAVGEVLIMGANRSGKTDFAAKYCIRRALECPETIIAIGAQTRATSSQVQQPRVWNYLPRELRGSSVKSTVEYINYKQQYGFSQNRVTFANGSQLNFISYEQGVLKIMEGPAFGPAWLDEEFVKEWLDSARFRLTSTLGELILTFTPVRGYTPVISDFLDGATVTRWGVGYLLPKDGGELCPWAQLGLSREEFEELQRFHNREVASCVCPESRPEDCFRWLEGDCSQEACVEEGRVFERVPRVAIKRDGSAAIVWFYGRDNPYGKPGQVIAAACRNRKATEEIRKRVYGVALKTSNTRFAMFDEQVHVVEVSRIPRLLARTFVCDPAPERNWFFLWLGMDVRGDVYVYREWPGGYEIPGVGVPGAWAEISSKKQGVNDGDRGEGQTKFGFGFLRYKYEWARLEGWEDARGSEEIPEASELEGWSSDHGAREVLRRRVLDGRAGSQSKMGAREDKTLFEICSELDVGFEPASGKRISSGEETINNLLNPPPGGQRLFVSSECRNVIFALRNYTGADGQKGACKEAIDCLRYALESGMLEDRPSEDDVGSSGGVEVKNVAPSVGDGMEIDFDL